MAVANQPALPPGASLEGVGQEQCARILFNLADWLRKKIITKLNDSFYVFTFNSTSNAPKTMELHFPCTSRLSNLPSTLQPQVFGWLLHLKLSTGGHLRPWCILYFIFFVDQFAAPNDRTVSPHALPAQRASALTPHLPVPPSLG